MGRILCTAPPCGGRGVTAIRLGRGSLARLGATYPHTLRARSSCAYLVLLRVEIAAFHPVCGHTPEGVFAPALTRRRSRTPTRLCCSDPHLAVDSR